MPKNVLFDRFMGVILAFNDVEEVEQAFEDELFKVFVQDHPKIDLVRINMSENGLWSSSCDIMSLKLII